MTGGAESLAGGAGFVSGGGAGRGEIARRHHGLRDDARGDPGTPRAIEDREHEALDLRELLLEVEEGEGLPELAEHAADEGFLGEVAAFQAEEIDHALAALRGRRASPLAGLNDSKQVGTADRERLLDTIETNAQRGGDIVRQLLAFGRGVEGERVVVQVRHIIIVGHSNCGGVRAALGHQSADLALVTKWLMSIKDVYRLHRDELDAIQSVEEKARRFVELNVIEQDLESVFVRMMQGGAN